MHETNSDDDKLKLLAITALLITPMEPAEYFAAGTFDKEKWSHFALHIPYYTHFTSPIRRYADVLVHRMLQCVLEGSTAVDTYLEEVLDVDSADKLAKMCNKRKEGAKAAQERSDRIFLALYLKDKPVESTMGVVIGIGITSFKILCPDLGIENKIYANDYKDKFEFNAKEGGEGQGKMILVTPKEGVVVRRG